MVVSGFGPYHHLVHDDAPTERAGVILTPWVMPLALGLGAIHLGVGAAGTLSHHHHVFVQFHGEPAIAQFAMNMYLYSHWHRHNFCHPPTERSPF
jgi:hypothetical protein